MATLVAQTISRTGIVPTRNAAAGGGDKFLNTGVEFAAIKNGVYAGSLNITNVARSGTTVTLTLSTDPTLVFTAGDPIIVAAVTNPSINGTWVITSMNSGAKTLVYTDTVSGTIASGADTGTLTGGPATVTIPIPVTVDTEAVASRTLSVAAGVEKIIGPFPPGTYNDTSGYVNMTYSGVNSLTVAVLAPGT